jgi:BirA family biotin operon repressor/biotin-[acetyl-CoA-carboxylase] ligase
MTFKAETLQSRLAPRPVRYFERTGSTNDDARAWLRAGAPEGAVVIADAQSSGRGRMGRAWQTPPGSALAVSLILRPSVDYLHQIGMIGARAIVDVAHGLGVGDVGIKWPNDVLVNGRKVSGVLPEVEWEGERLLGVVLGMGINVSVDFSGTPLAESAISLEMAVGRPLDRLDVLADLLGRVDACYRSSTVFAVWKSHLRTLGQMVTVGSVSGVAEDVDVDGALLVRDEQGEVQRVIAGDLFLSGSRK